MLAVSAAFVLYSCAKVMMPTGGPKDETPPVLLSTLPNHKTLNFSEDGFLLTFNEFIEIKSPQENVVVSPPLAKNPTYLDRGKSVFVRFNSKLDSNTTYVFNFGDAIVDFTEGNPTPNLKYVFSTGNYLDSLVLHGRVLDAWTGEPIANATAMLFPDFIDSAAVEYRPFYVTKSNSRGEYKFSFLRPDFYQIAIVKDENRNLKYDRFEERVAFLSDYIELNQKSDTLLPVAYMFREKKPEQEIKSIKASSRKRLEVVTSRSAYQGAFTLIEPINEALSIEFLLPRRDSLVVWLPNFAEDFDEELTLVFTDTTHQFIDTLKVDIPSPPKKRKGDNEYKRTRGLKLESNFRSSFNYADTMLLSFSEPVVTLDASAFVLLKDTIPQKFSIQPAPFSQRHFYVLHPWEENTQYTLSAPDSIIFGMYNTVADSIHITAVSQKYSYFGALSIEVVYADSLFKGTPVLEIFDSKKKLVRRVINPKEQKIEFPVLNPDKYAMKLIDDLNGNFKWDHGLYLEWVQPETVYQYNQEIDVRSNWELDVKWTVTPKEE